MFSLTFLKNGRFLMMDSLKQASSIIVIRYQFITTNFKGSFAI
ncbi:hypothetical protein M23134_02790 [Microscilla marina ATCC 23134]|uniref:Uncharacterized protein n=1 Tax=Microscilla marina ATCC 23134 TaxID=313606 RepID=A1ZPN8_MICM2|nr:hypothetical protein M23134_02790 [Microscilla marina ATCC 23134]